MLPYEYDPSLPLNLEVSDEGDVKVLRFDAPYEPVVPQSRRIVVYHFPSEAPKANLVFLHGIRNGNIPYLMWFARWFSRHGINSYFLLLPYHGERAPKGWKGGEPFFSPSPAYCVLRFHEAVKDVRRTIDVIGVMNDLPTSVMGYSFGGMIATLAMAIDERIENGILAFTGGNWRWINWRSPVTEELRRMYKEQGNEHGCRSEQDCIRMRGNLDPKFGSVRDIFEKAPVGCFKYDPISFAPFIERPVLFFRGLFDRVIPKQSTIDLIRHLRNVKVVTLPCGHKSSYFFRRVIAWISLGFMTEGR